mgnify:FL=1
MNYIKIDENELMEWLKESLDEERYEHSIGVAEYAVKLAKQYGLNEEKAYVAGLLHDCAKCFSTGKMLRMVCETVKIEPSEKDNFKTLHAPVSAYVAEHDFGVTDKEILSAIRWHTIGKIQMTNFEKIIFIADKVEERTREVEIAQPIRDCLSEENGLNKALLQCYKQTIKSLVDRNLKICTLTIDIYNHLEDEVYIK